jgi:prepilin-type N-terminal cleavage/methylation domain-containing protein
MNRIGCRERGFSFLELMTAVAIIAILGALAVVGYQEYTTRAAAADLVSAHHNIRTNVLAQGDKTVPDCTALAAGYDRKLLNDPYAALDYGFEAVAGGGYRPVLTVCATAGGPGRVAVVKRAYESFSAMGVAEKSSTTSDTLASFSVRLTDGDKALCKTAPASRGGCGQVAAPAGQAKGPAPVQGQPAQPANAGAPAQPSAGSQAVATVQPTCPAGQQMTTLNVAGTWQRSCAPTCAAGQRLNAATKQCVTDSAQSQGSTRTSLPPGTSPQVVQQVQQAETALTQGLAQASTPQEALAKTLAAAQSLPPAVLTQSVLGNSETARKMQATCRLPDTSSGPCGDFLTPGSTCTGMFPTAFGPGAQPDCVVARICPKTLGICQGVTPEMRRMLDESMQRIVSDWFAQHPGCTTFGQAGC